MTMILRGHDYDPDHDHCTVKCWRGMGISGSTWPIWKELIPFLWPLPWPWQWPSGILIDRYNDSYFEGPRPWPSVQRRTWHGHYLKRIWLWSWPWSWPLYSEVLEGDGEIREHWTNLEGVKSGKLQYSVHFSEMEASSINLIFLLLESIVSHTVNIYWCQLMKRVKIYIIYFYFHNFG